LLPLLSAADHHSASADRPLATTLLICVMLRPQRLLPRTGALTDVRDMNTNNDDGDDDQEVI